MDRSDIKLDMEQRARAVALEPQVVDDPEWASAVIIWQRDELATLRAKVAELEARKDGAYLERNQVVSALAKCFPSGTARTAIEGWSEDWHGCVYIDLPTGQVSWHFHDSHAHLFADLPPYAGKWDGHDTPEKYLRLADLLKDVGAARSSTDAANGREG